MTPALGRNFLPEEDVAGAERVVIVSDGFWKQRLGSNPNVVGTSLSLNGTPATIVGAMRPDFHFPESAHLWFPARSPNNPQSRGQHSYTVLGRLAPGVTMAMANKEVAGIARQLEIDYPQMNAKRGARMQASTKASTLGLGCLLIGAGLQLADLASIIRLLSVGAFTLLTTPVSAHLIARAAYRAEIPLWDGTVLDERREALKQD